MQKKTDLVKDFIENCWLANFDSSCISEVLSENCLHQKSIGKCIGIDSFISDCQDWSKAFPDYGTRIQKIKTYKNFVICDVQRFGTHLDIYESTNPDKKTILSTSSFFKEIEGLPPTGNSYLLPAKLIVAFEKNKISQIIIEEEPEGLIQDLKIGNVDEAAIANDNSLLDIQTLSRFLQHAFDTSLTRREVECIALGFCGFSAKHIAEILQISFRTVESHLQNGYIKLDCRGKQEMLECMYESKMLTLWLDLGKLLLLLRRR